jgi:pheromone a factor receptor
MQRFVPDLVSCTVTKFLLAATVAISGAFLCMSYRLELLSSSRPISVDPKSRRNRILMDFIYCYVVPIIYMAFRTSHFLAYIMIVRTHFLPKDLITQDHRFDLVEEIGCSASIHPSSPALILMWLPPLIICSISFCFIGRFISSSIGYVINRSFL